MSAECRPLIVWAKSDFLCKICFFLSVEQPCIFFYYLKPLPLVSSAAHFLFFLVLFFFHPNSFRSMNGNPLTFSLCLLKLEKDLLLHAAKIESISPRRSLNPRSVRQALLLIFLSTLPGWHLRGFKKLTFGSNSNDQSFVSYTNWQRNKLPPFSKMAVFFCHFPWISHRPTITG